MAARAVSGCLQQATAMAHTVAPGREQPAGLAMRHMQRSWSSLHQSRQSRAHMQRLQQMVPRAVPPAGTNEATYFVRKNLRSGTAVNYPQGNVVVLGDVNPGSAVIAGGDIAVWGRLLGEAQAGAKGNRKAQIQALELNPTRLQIDDVVASGSELAAAAAMSPGPKTVHIGGRDASLQIAAGLLDAGDSWLSDQNSSRLRSCRRASIITGCYALLFGLLLVAAPAKVFGLLFDPSQVPAGWIQVGGVLLATFGLQYLISGMWPSFELHDTVEKQVWSKASSFYVASVWSRAFLVVMFCALVALQRVEVALLALAALNLVGLLGMQRALTRKAPQAVQPAAAWPYGSSGLAEGYVVGGDGMLLASRSSDSDDDDSSAAPSPAQYYMNRLQ